MSLKLSVIICTHNPTTEYFKRTLRSLEEQTLPKQDWELIIVDNASSLSVSKTFDVSWHPLGRFTTEPALGLTPARLRGILMAKGELLVFVDDDNVLESNYLEEVRRISIEFACLGAWGAGQIVPEFEVPPPAASKRYLPFLTLRSHAVPHWSNNMDDARAVPFGAGLCVRREVALLYREGVIGDQQRNELGRRGSELSGSEDLDMAFSSRLLGLGWGTFPTLGLTHLISKSRLVEDYLVRLMEGTHRSLVVLGAKCGRSFEKPAGPLGFTYKAIRIALWQGRRPLRFYLAKQKGLRRGHLDTKCSTGGLDGLSQDE